VSTQEIYNYKKVNEGLSTGGQPTEEQLQAAAREGFQAVINLATFDPQHSLPDEAGLVRSLGMAYFHIPVAWGNPQEADFAAFENAMAQAAGQKTLIHCAANFRVTAFYSLYATKHLSWTEAQADQFRASIWQGSNYPVWEQFIQRIKDKIAGS
jgi:uncharacterized protein (TIGR01244 family)